MPTTTQKDAVLVLSLDGADYACQVINAEFAYPGKGEATTIPVACGGDPVSEPGSPTNGSISGEVFKDTGATGITRALITALESEAEMDYIWTEGADDAADRISITGKCRVAGHTQTFAPDTTGRHALNLSVSTAATTFGVVTP
jgi:hypothetical protein